MKASGPSVPPHHPRTSARVHVPGHLPRERVRTRRLRRPWSRPLRRAARRRKPNLIPRTSRRESAALRAIVAMKGLKSATLLVVGLGLFAVVERDLGAMALSLAEALHFDVHRAFIEDLVHRLADLTVRQKAAGGAGAIVYASILAIEAAGLARRRAWAAWLAVGVGAALLPIEVWELLHRPGVRLAAALALNVAVVAYLVVEARRARRGPPVRPFDRAGFEARRLAHRPLPHESGPPPSPGA